MSTLTRSGAQFSGQLDRSEESAAGSVISTGSQVMLNNIASTLLNIVSTFYLTLLNITQLAGLGGD